MACAFASRQQPPPLELKGHRVFAGRNIEKGELLEQSPVIPVPANEWALVRQTSLRHYGYTWGREGKDGAIALGYGSLLRSTGENPAAYYVKNFEGLVIEFFAARDVRQGEEITVERQKKEG